jgi:GTP-binding protein
MSQFIDEVRITVKSGNGGPGAVSFRREIYVPRGGPDGGDGGAGGDVILKTTSNLQTLIDLKLKRLQKAENGHRGEKKNSFGSRGQDCVIPVPCGTIVRDAEGEILADLTLDGQTYVAAKGGKGGKGNSFFATSTHQAPRFAQPGIPGESRELHLELRLIAQVGLVGLPNAGKSTLLKALTRANPKIAAYPFTTLFPNLGVLRTMDREIILADIPGLIEGASNGQGLGSDFLKHIARTEVILHLVAITPDDPEQVWKDYCTVNEELRKSELNLLEKPRHVLLSKADLVPEEDLSVYQDLFTEKGVSTTIISGASGYGLDGLTRILLESCP